MVLGESHTIQSPLFLTSEREDKVARRRASPMADLMTVRSQRSSCAIEIKARVEATRRKTSFVKLECRNRKKGVKKNDSERRHPLNDGKIPFATTPDMVYSLSSFDNRGQI